MHTFIAALAGLSLTSSVSAPLVTNQIQNSTTLNPTPLRSAPILIHEQNRKIRAQEGDQTWNVIFFVEGSAGRDQTGRINFEGGELALAIGWGEERWNYRWDYIDVGASLPSQYLVNDHHTSGLASQYASLRCDFAHYVGGYYTWQFYLYARTSLSFSHCWAELTIKGNPTFNY